MYIYIYVYIYMYVCVCVCVSIYTHIYCIIHTLYRSNKIIHRYYTILQVNNKKRSTRFNKKRSQYLGVEGCGQEGRRCGKCG